MATVRRPRPTAPTRRKLLDAHAAQVQGIILARQDEHTGLLPASTAITVHGDYTHAWVRDNVYSILAVWALALAWRREDTKRAAPLEDSVVRLMRGLLAAMTKQAHKVEVFKHTQKPLDALHAKYDTRSGEAVVGDDAWGHLQLDATAIFLLFLAQMSASGLRIVQSADEVAFVQNLVHYLAKAYRTPDFGIWERGHKRNEGVAEVNASSLGMAKAALEAIDGCRFLPGAAPAIHVAADDIAHARDTLAGLLPRESASKETDAALLAIVGFPAFALDDADLEARTRDEIVNKLQGRYGCKRFLRDGHQTVLEDHGRLHYEPGELAQFEHIESEWPLFFTYLLLDAALRGDTALAEDYRRRLDGLLQERDGQRLLPELYFVPAEAVAAERAAPHSQARVANENVPLVWAQSLYVVGALLLDGCITADDLDPLGRRQRAPAPTPPCLQVALLAEDGLVQSRLAAHGIVSQTPAEAAPVRVGYAQQLEAALAELGRCEALGLSGRPRHPLGALATSQRFTLGAQQWVFLPTFSDRPGFYLALDNGLLVDEIAAEIAYIRRHWRGSGQPLLALLITEPMLDVQGADVLIAFLKSLADDTTTTRVAPLATLCAEPGAVELDWLARLPDEVSTPAPTAGVDALLSWEEAATRPLTPARLAALARVGDAAALGQQLAASRNPYEQAAILDLLWRREGPAFTLAGGLDLRQATVALYARAGRRHLWGVLRRAAGLLDLLDDSLEDAVAHLVVRHKRIMVGRAPAAGAVISRPLSHAEIGARLREFGGEDGRARALIQEVVLLLGTLVKADPALLQGTLTVRPWTLVELIIGWLAREHGVTPAEAFDHLLDLSPQAILSRLREVIAHEQEMTAQLQRSRSLYVSGGSEQLKHIRFLASGDPARGSGEDSWQVWREMTGVMTRVRPDFYERVWGLLQHGRGLVVGDPLDSRNVLDSALLLADTTASEPAFALQVEDLLNKIHEPAYRQLTIEALLAVSEICRANPQLKIDGWLVVDVLLAQAVALNWKHATSSNPDGDTADDIEDTARAWQLFYASEPHRVANFVMEAFALLLHERTEAAASQVETPDRAAA